MADLALQLIKEASKKKLTKLDLGNYDLREIPDELYELVDLEELNLGASFYDSDSDKYAASPNNGSPNSIGYISSQIKQLKRLKVLHLSRNKISDIRFLEELTNLQILDLSRNGISDIRLLKRLINLQTLHLSYNGVSDIRFLEKLTNLQTLTLSGNKIGDYSILQGLTNLQTLHLSSNGISDIRFLEKLTNLQTFDLSDNKIRDTDFLERLTNLQTLNLSGNKIGNIRFLGGLTNLQTLNLSRNGISDIRSLAGMANLQTLSLSSNEIDDIRFLGGLANLQTLHLSRNRITNIRSLEDLTKLQTLNLSGNEISDIRFLERLINLQTLRLSVNNISDYSILEGLTGLQALHLSRNGISDIRFLRGLTNLQTLDLSVNGIGDIRYLEELTNLQTLNLSYNRIRDITPIRYLIEKTIPVKWEDDYSGEHIVLQNNPLTIPPPEIVKKGNEAVLNYFRELNGEGAAYVYEAKLLVIGEGEAGKTTLVRKLKDENAPMPEEKDTTRGISIERYFFKTAEDKDFQINTWDFGGQEIYHATHQFFLTKRALYILVDNTRKDDKNRDDAAFDYWLQVTNLYGSGSPLLIVQNEKDDRTKALDVKGMQARFDFIKDRFSTNLLTGRGLKEVREAIHYQIQRLSHVGEKLPKTWVDVRRELEGLAGEKDFVSLEAYLAICAKHGMEEERALYLSSFLHDLGSFLHFQEHPVLKNIFILNNRWATDAVYKVLDNEKIKAAFGRFTRVHLKEIWSDAKYKFKHEELLALMTKFELCYELKDSTDTWLAPQLLPEETPTIDWDKEGNLVVRYTYDFMPKGLLPRFVVRMHRYIRNSSLSWRSGAMLERRNTAALVTEAYGSREIVIRVKGFERKELMTLITEDFDDMHSKFENLKVKKLIPCNCAKCKNAEQPVFYEYDDLIKRKEREKRTIECKESYDDVDVTSLLDGVFTDISKATEAAACEKSAPRVFLSYSHKDETLKEELDKHFTSLKRSGKISVWQDRKLGGGAEWDGVIKKELNEADIILLLVSSDFMASEYIWNVEIKSAIERHNRGEAKVVPVFLRHCDFGDMPFEKLQGYPKDAKPVTSFPDRDEAFVQVAKGIRRDIEDWKK